MDHIDYRVHEHKEYLKTYCDYKEDSLLGVFAFGSMNYGLYEEGISDVDTKAIYVPTYKEMVFDKSISKKYTYGDEQIEVKDIRLMVDMFKKQNINFVEIIFTNYSWINPKYSYLWANTFYLYRHAIAEYNPEYFATSVCGQARGYIRDLQKAYNPKKAANLIRLQATLNNFLHKQISYDRAINFTFLPAEIDETCIENIKLKNQLLKYKHDELRLSDKELENLYSWFEDFPTEGIKRKIGDDRRKVMDMLFQDWILAILKEREVTLK